MQKNRLNFGVSCGRTQLIMIEMLHGQWQLRKSWSVSLNKEILASLRRMFPYILGKCQIGKCQALTDYMDSGRKNSHLFAMQW